jgi:Predicted AAA-ATPase
MKFPYGIADFYQVRTEDYFYVDRTAHIRMIEDAGKQLLFLRPRRFGKSLLLSTLENYYDVAKADDFERLFGDLAIGRNPTPKRNQYFVLEWDFSAVEPRETPEQMRDTLHSYINGQIQAFRHYYDGRLAHGIDIDPHNAIASFQSLLSAVNLTSHKLYLLIDEYDNFANEILMGGQASSRVRYDALLQGEGALKAVFKNIKAAAAGGGLDRVFITGVAPVVLSDMSSGYNVAKDIYLNPRFHDMCGFTEKEIARVVAEVAAACGSPADAAETAVTQMQLYYNGYQFADTAGEPIYNPTLALYFLDHFHEHCRMPEDMLDGNLAMDRGKLRYIAGLPGGPRVIVDALQNDAGLSVPALSNRFGVEDLLTERKDRQFMASLLYYFGVLTQAGRNVLRERQLRIPNLVMRKLYVERLQALLLPDLERDEAREAAGSVYQTGNLEPLCNFVEQRYFNAFDNRDYLQANELTLKTPFLTLLFNDLLYITDSETEVGRRYADLTMIVRPDARQGQLVDLLLEFKFVKLGEAGLTGAEARALSREELAALPLIRQKLADARAQTADYVRTLRARYAMELRLRVYAVVGMGFERLVWEEIAE